MNPFSRAKFLPQSLVQELCASSAAEFRDNFTGVQLLLVRLDPRVPDLVHGLTQILEIDGVLPTSPTFTSATTEMLVRSVVLGDGDPADYVDRGQLKLLAKLESQNHFVLPLLKRKQPKVDPFRVHVGRSLENDVVLLDAAVSSRHGWFEWDSSGALAVQDGNSRNGTRVNGRRLNKDERCWLQPMDQIEFGNVDTFICEPAVLRGMLRLSSSETAE